MKVRAYAVPDPASPLAPHVIERRRLGPHDVAVAIDFCGVCHSDIHQARDEWGDAIYPMVPGHEIVGRVAEVGDAVSAFSVGERAGVGVFVDSCRVCEACRAGEEQYCDAGMSPTYNGLEQDGVTPTYGGYSEGIVVDEHYVLHLPEQLDPAAAAPLMCAGITTYSPIRHFKVRPGDRTAVVGLGGLGHMAVKFLNALGAEVTVVSRSESKRESALALGAGDVIVTTSDGAFEANRKRFDFMIDTVAGEHPYDPYLKMLRRDGTMVQVGLPSPAPIDPATLAGARRRLAGSVIGGIRETAEMLSFCATHGIVADIEHIAMQDINAAFERTIAGDVQYRFVIDMDSLRREAHGS